MTITPRELLDTSIAQLETLAAFLSDQLGETGGKPPMQSDALEVLACREVLFSLSFLIHKAQVAHCAGPGAPLRQTIRAQEQPSLFNEHSAQQLEGTSRPPSKAGCARCPCDFLFLKLNQLG
jgi:hypothetical protein